MPMRRPSASLRRSSHATSGGTALFAHLASMNRLLRVATANPRRSKTERLRLSHRRRVRQPRRRCAIPASPPQHCQRTLVALLARSQPLGGRKAPTASPAPRSPRPSPDRAAAPPTPRPSDRRAPCSPQPSAAQAAAGTVPIAARPASRPPCAPASSASLLHVASRPRRHWSSAAAPPCLGELLDPTSPAHCRSPLAALSMAASSSRPRRAPPLSSSSSAVLGGEGWSLRA